MKRSLILSLWAIWAVTTALNGQDYQEAWKAIGDNNREAARKSLKGLTTTDAYLTATWLDTYDNKLSSASTNWNSAVEKVDNLYPYLFAFWYEDFVVGEYGQKSADQLKLLTKLSKTPNVPGDIKAAVNYQKGHHAFSNRDWDEMHSLWASTSNVLNWQFVGAFDNTAQSGFDKQNEPITKPESTHTFKSKSEADIKWFSPSIPDKDGWITPGFFIQARTGITYAQSFVNVPNEMDVTMGLGFTGNLKVWVNDALMFSEREVYKTDFDAFSVKIHLNAGYNRILVQIGYEDNNYNNFSLRLTDDMGNLLPDITSSATFQSYAKDTKSTLPKVKPFWAETYFEDKIKAEPDNLINYVFLCRVYLRSEKGQLALKVINQALEKQPDNAMLHFERTNCYSVLDNNTDRVKELQYIQDKDPLSYLGLRLDFQDALNNEDLTKADQLLSKRAGLYTKNESYYTDLINLQLKQEKMEDLLQTIDKASADFPLSTTFAQMQFQIAVQVRQNAASGRLILKNFLKQKYDANVAGTLADAYFESGSTGLAVDILKEIEGIYPFSPSGMESLYNYYFGSKDNKNARVYIDKMLKQAPFVASYHDQNARLYEQVKDQKLALEAFKKALHYDPNSFSTRKRIRELEGKDDLYSKIEQDDPYQLIQKTKGVDKEGEYNEYYVANTQATIVYNERCSESYHTIIVRVLTDKGVNSWKETSIGYNPWRQELIIEKAEVVKPNGTKIPADQNQNQVVFEKLEKGDFVLIKYRVTSYAYSRMSREFWDKFYFSYFIPADLARYTLMVHKDVPVQFKTVNFELQPTESTTEEFKNYVWEARNTKALKRESFMQSGGDVLSVLHITTLPEWTNISDWYNDLSTPQAKPDPEVKEVVATLFPTGKTFTELQKARIIYDYIVKNINYSSVSFRQSAYVPQKANKVIMSKLGDCKDVSTLYATIAREAGLKANLMLVNTRNNGEKDLSLPSPDFNHCIVKVIADGTPWYLELTDRNLPFGSLPDADFGAAVLEIPYNAEKSSGTLFPLFPKNRLPNLRDNKTRINITDVDFNIHTDVTLTGASSSFVRNKYREQNREKQMEAMQRSLADKFTNKVIVKGCDFGDLFTLNDTLQYHAQYDVKNQVVEIGELQTFKVPFFHTFVKADAFPEDERKFAIAYWDYEETDQYDETVTVSVPEGRRISDIPKDVNLSFNGTVYSLRYVRDGDTRLNIIRTIKVNRDNIPAEKYDEFKKFVQAIVTAENKYVAFR